MKYISLITIAILISLSAAANKTFTMSCETCTITCSFSTCFRVKGAGIDTLLCSKHRACNTTNNYTVMIGRSNVDMIAQPCQSGLILYLSGPVSICMDPPGGCAAPYNFTMKCGDCVNIANCKKCQQAVVMGVIMSETCIGDACGIVATTMSGFAPCTTTGDSAGNTCPCCQNMFSSNSTGGLSLCLDNFDFLNTPQVLTWYNTYSSNTTNTTNSTKNNNNNSQIFNHYKNIFIFLFAAMIMAIY